MTVGREQPLSTHAGWVAAVWCGVSLAITSPLYALDAFGVPGTSLAWHLTTALALILMAVALGHEVRFDAGKVEVGNQPGPVCNRANAQLTVRAGLHHTGSACLHSLSLAIVPVSTPPQPVAAAMSCTDII